MAKREELTWSASESELKKDVIHFLAVMKREAQEKKTKKVKLKMYDMQQAFCKFRKDVHKVEDIQIQRYAFYN